MRIIFIFLFLLMLGSCTENKNLSYEDAKTSLEKLEKLKPHSFLSHKGKFSHSYTSIWVLDGTITNKALITTYDNLVMNIQYFTDNDMELGSELRSIPQSISPGQTIQFTLRTFSFSQAKKIRMEIESAVAID